MSLFGIFGKKPAPKARAGKAVIDDLVLQELIEESKTSLESLQFLKDIEELLNREWGCGGRKEDAKKEFGINIDLVTKERTKEVNERIADAFRYHFYGKNAEHRKYALQNLYFLDEIPRVEKADALLNGFADGTLGMNEIYYLCSCASDRRTGQYDPLSGRKINSFFLKSLKERIEFVLVSSITRGGDFQSLKLIEYIKEAGENFLEGINYLQELGENPKLQRSEIVEKIFEH